MKKGLKTTLIVAVGCIAVGGVLMGAGRAAGGYDELGYVNRGWHPIFGSSWMFGMRGIPFVENIADSIADQADRWAERWEEKAERAAEKVEQKIETAANRVENSFDNAFYDNDWDDDWDGDDWDDDDIDDDNESRGWANNGYFTGADKDPGQEVYNGDFTKEIAYAGAITDLKVEMGLHHLVVKEGTDQKLTLKAERADQIQCYVKDGKLYIKEVGRKKVPKNSKKRKLVLTVPAALKYNEADINADMGSVKIDRLQAAEAELDADMGSIEIGDLTAAEKADMSADMGTITIKKLNAPKKAELNADMGTITVKDAAAGAFDAETGMGSIEWTGTIAGNAAVSASMGSIELNLDQKREDFNYVISGSMGSVELDGKSYGGLSKTKKIDNGASWKMNLDSSMGSIDISFK